MSSRPANGDTHASGRSRDPSRAASGPGSAYPQYGPRVDRLAAQMPSPDREVLRDPAFRPVLEANATKAWGRGTGYMLDDGRALYSWGFDPATVTQHVDLFHGQTDTLAPLPMARALADSLPAARLHVIAGEGHMIGLTRWDELVTALAARLPTPSDR